MEVIRAPTETAATVLTSIFLGFEIALELFFTYYPQKR